MIIVEAFLTIKNPTGLHARPTNWFAQTARTFESNITVTNLTRQGQPVNGKDVVLLLGAGLKQHHTLHLLIEGEDAEEAMAILIKLIEELRI